MTDTGQIPGEGLPENAVGEAAPQPHTDALGAPQATAPGWGTEQPAELGAPAYTYLDQPAAPGAGLDDDDDVLLMPGPQGTWSDPQPVPPQPSPVAETPAPDYGTPQAVDTPSPAPAAPRRPLHMGPPVHDTPSGGVSVRSLADRGPAQGGQLPPPARLQSGPPTSGPEYLDVPQDDGHGIPAQQTGDSADPAALSPGTAWPAAQTPSQQSLIPHADSVIPAQQAPEPILAFPPAEAAPTPPAGAEQPAYTAAPVTPSAPAGEQPAVPAAATPAAAEPVAEPVAAVAAQAVARPVPVAAVAEQAVVPPVSADAPAAPVAAAAEQAGVPPLAAGTVAPAVEPAAGPVAPQGEQGEGAVPVAPVPAPAAEQTPAGGTPVAPAEVAEAGPVLSGPAAALSGALQEVAPTPPIGLDLSAPPSGPAFGEQPAADGSAFVSATGTANLAALVASAGNTPAAEAGSPTAPEPVQPAEAAVPAAEAAPEQAAPETVVPAEAAEAAEPAPAPAVEETAEAVAVPKGRTVRRASRAHAAEAPAHTDQGEQAEPEAESGTEPAAPKGRRAARRAEARAAEAEAPEPAEAYEPAVRDAVHRVIRERRDIRNGFRSDPIPHDVLLRVLEAAHTAPSVGHSQPWDFVVIRSEKTREKMHELAMAQREAYAKSLPKGRARQFRELKIEAILDTPVNIVVTADPTRGGRHTLGRHTQPQMAPYSSALAVENLWLAARAEGLGVGWVSFFDERQMVAELGLPEHLEVVAYLCVGYVDEFPEEPELMQAGWSQRRPLSWVVHEEEYGNRALPGEEPHDLLEETLRGIRPLDAKALGEAWERQKRMTKPAGALGMLEIISAQLSGLSRQCPPPIPEPAAVAIFAGDHGVHAQGVTAWPQEVTGQMVANFLGGGAVCNAFANQVGAEVCVIDVGVASELPGTPGLLPRKVRPGTADFTTGPAMTREEALRAIEVGIETARDLVAAGNKALLTGEMGIANTTTSAALIAVFTGVDPAEVTGRGTGINDEMHARKVDVVRRALDLHRPDPADPIAVLTAIGGLEHAAMVGLLLGASALRTPVILDGVSAGAAALVARAIAPEVLAACIAGHRSAEPGHVAALTTLGLRPLVDLDLRLGEGTGALLALPLVQSAARVMHEVATFDAAGVTEKA
ncbi:nicotinate-nucleotide--dimethylbenzimidazole phosphoribosyltransferase [Actinacidiphila bryophytorum]|uniref:nicotinate-nucleotide--dimethylbenzimidazole phosphoribosyltransferase n=1 Tax=Actinacidiphila bryophytorum TaxID=1436133 RepID=UPI002176A4D3|nr:nicotinate-nucleotide--dimethylbenzimidazole phosphoribosyltransferase [Actinacidiphila bryophytorum]UWE09382.1 nicotinate-nucleotide--dimethylbenzimidazole phosphoribosyltransferase [Actinacidiphila bryophytorum]